MAVSDPLTGQKLGAEEDTSGPAYYLRSVERQKVLGDRLMLEHEPIARRLALKGAGDVRTAPGDPAQSINLSHCYMDDFVAQACGEPVHLRYDRDAGAGQVPVGEAPPGAAPPVPGDEVHGRYVEEFGSRILEEADCERETESVIRRLGAHGSSGWWIGYHADVSGLEEALAASMDPSEASVAAAKGLTIPHPESDHATQRQVLYGAAKEMPAAAPDITVQQLNARAGAADKMGEKARKDPTGNPAIQRHGIWIRRASPGVDTFWGPSRIFDVKDARWFCRLHYEPLADFKANTSYKQSARTKIEGKFNATLTNNGTTTSGTQTEAERDQTDPQERLVPVYTFWIKMPKSPDGGIRRIATPELRDEWIETNSRNPNLELLPDNTLGRPLINGFFPYFHTAPDQPPIDDPERPFGIPLVAPGIRTEDRINEFLSSMVAHGKRHGFRLYGLHPLLKGRQRTDLLDALRRGVDGHAFSAPAGAVKDGKNDMAALVHVYQFSGNAPEMEAMLAALINFWRIEMRVSQAVLMGVDTSGTATQAELAQSAGSDSMGGKIGRVERDFARMVKGVLGLARGRIKYEQARSMLGTEGADAIEAWRRSSDAGDRMEVRFGPRARRADHVDVKQVMETIGVVRTSIDPLTKQPRVDDLPYIDELVRSQKLGKVRLIPQVVMESAQLLEKLQAVKAAQEQGQPQGGKPGEPPQGGPPGGEDEGPKRAYPSGAKPSEGGGPTNANQNSGSRRGTVTV